MTDSGKIHADRSEARAELHPAGFGVGVGQSGTPGIAECNARGLVASAMWGSSMNFSQCVVMLYDLALGLLFGAMLKPHVSHDDDSGFPRHEFRPDRAGMSLLSRCVVNGQLPLPSSCCGNMPQMLTMHNLECSLRPCKQTSTSLTLPPAR